MTTTVPLSALVAPTDNPRRTYDKKAVEGLAQSIKKDGVLQNLTVHPAGKNKYRVIAGKRRYLALQHLKRQGDIDGSYRVPIRFNKKATPQDLDRIATVENVQREALDPIEEADAFAKLLGDGTKIEDIAAQTGISVQTIRRRAALADLLPAIKQAVQARQMPLSVAEVFTLLPKEQQKSWFASWKRSPTMDARYVRSTILSEKPSVAIALFPAEQYQGTFTKDLFAEDDATFFDDREQFMRLQQEAVERLAEEHRKSAAWVEVNTEHMVSWWQYGEAKKKERGGVVIHMPPTGRVEVRKGLVRRQVDPEATRARNKAKKPRVRAAISKATYRYANAHKTLAMQMALMEHPRKAKEAAAVLLLHGSREAGITLKAHDALRELAKYPGSSGAYDLIDSSAQRFLAKLGVHAEGGEVPSWARLHRAGADWTQVISGIRLLSGIELDALITLLVILCFGTVGMEGEEPEATFFSGLAKDLTLDMRTVWTPDEVFLKGLPREELLKVAGSTGALRKHPKFGSATKRDLVQGLVSYFKRTADPKAVLDETEAPARAWLPACMQLGTGAGAAARAKKS